jgi:molecular chaperone DnaK
MRTMQIGIDLGTTNSAIGVVIEDRIEIVKNSLGEETTPSVVYADKSGTLIVGTKAKQKAFQDNRSNASKNWKAEIKRLMGTSEAVWLPHLSRPMSPEEVSAEILKSLRADLERKFPKLDLRAAVITVPAHFSTVQAEATKRAGVLAGFTNVVLLQEPIAAAMSYGLTASANENWLVYDLGGGTFDVALVASRDGHLTILAHGVIISWVERT